MEHKEMEQGKDRHNLEKRGYIMRRLLGRGAFSRVYSVEERSTGRRAACKVGENGKLFKREEEILKRLKYPLFPEYYGSWKEDRSFFLLMEEVVGESLAGLIKRGECLPVCQIAGVGMELAEGLLYLHESRPAIIFRDVKPENIILRKDGHVKLLDFGCACMPDTADGTRAGTPGYSAPEQLAEGGAQTCLCDVYGLGRTLQELLWAGAHRGVQARGNGNMQRCVPGCGGVPARGNGNMQRCVPGCGGVQARGNGNMQRCVPGYKGISALPWGQQGKERVLKESFGERRDRKRLERLLAACVQEAASARPADMRVVMAALIHICPSALGAGRWENRNQKGRMSWHINRHRGWQRYQSSDFWQKGVICEKNIRRSSWKTS